jgi:prepilin-type N-terminal cleavage/methylation domain-containing protein
MFMKRNGFTLIELLIVIAIIGILAVIAIPGYVGQQKSATRTEAYTNLQNLRLLEEQFFAENGAYTASIASYNGTPLVADGGIEDTLRGFRPGDVANLNFTYAIVQNKDINDADQTPCFRATATGKAGSRVAGDSFTIDCNNNRNF